MFEYCKNGNSLQVYFFLCMNLKYVIMDAKGDMLTTQNRFSHKTNFISLLLRLIFPKRCCERKSFKK